MCVKMLLCVFVVVVVVVCFCAFCDDILSMNFCWGVGWGSGGGGVHFLR